MAVSGLSPEKQVSVSAASMFLTKAEASGDSGGGGGGFTGKVWTVVNLSTDVDEEVCRCLEILDVGHFFSSLKPVSI